MLLVGGAEGAGRSIRPTKRLAMMTEPHPMDYNGFEASSPRSTAAAR